MFTTHHFFVPNLEFRARDLDVRLSGRTDCERPGQPGGRKQAARTARLQHGHTASRRLPGQVRLGPLPGPERHSRQDSNGLPHVSWRAAQRRQLERRRRRVLLHLGLEPADRSGRTARRYEDAEVLQYYLRVHSRSVGDGAVGRSDLDCTGTELFFAPKIIPYLETPFIGLASLYKFL